MGAKLLNSFLKSKFPRTIKKKHWECLSRKKIVIDTNNYIYKFLSEDNLMGGFLRMCDMFRYYNIIPLFIFDGKPSKIKIEELKERKKVKKEAKEIFINKKYLTNKEKIELKRKFINVTENETNIVKELLNAYGMKYMNAPEESDELCCKLVNIGKVYACLSEDMDMFIYGCKRVLRGYSNCNYIYMYDINIILNNLKLSLKDFKYLILISNMKENIFKLYKKMIQDNFDLFSLLNNDSTNQIKNLYDYYNLEESDVLSKCNYILIKLYNYNKMYINLLRKKLPQVLHFFPT